MKHINSFHVPAGSLYVGESQPTEVYALLGTCVGVALYSPEAQMGGIIHLMLPEPTPVAGKHHPERYATTGLPILLNHFLEASIQPKSLKACIAGGAIMGPVDNMDLRLDIGGRTVEAVNAFLESAKIRVSKSETGGYTGRRLILDMQNWESCIEPNYLEKNPIQEDNATPNRSQIIQSMETLQPIPQIALKILRQSGKDTCDFRAIASEIQKDQVLIAKVLRLCNSSWFYRKTPIESFVQALILLGYKAFLQLVISACVEEQFHLSSLGYSLCKGGLYHHALATAIISEELARHTGKADPHTAYTAGLLHDIGKVVLDQCVASSHPIFYRMIQKTGLPADRVEKELFGIDHCEAGGLLAESWSLPETLREAIRFHHTPDLAGSHGQLPHIVHLADMLARGFNPVLKTHFTGIRNLAQSLEKIGCRPEELAVLVDLIPAEVLAYSYL